MAQFIAAVPTVLNLGAQVWIWLPISNIGAAPVEAITVTSISLGAVPLISPTSFPVVEGALGSSDTLSIGAVFNGETLSVGERQLLTVRGTYLTDGTVSGFALNQLATVPSPAANAPQLLNATIGVTQTHNTWNYVLTNNEDPVVSSFYVSSVAIDLSVPVSVTGTPAGWNYDTDGATYVLWYTDNEAAQIAPGKSLSGFQLSSTATKSVANKVALTSWDQAAETAGPVMFLRVATPSS